MTQASTAASPASRREIWAWSMYDWANSAYTTLSITVLVNYINKVVVGPKTEIARDMARWASALGIQGEPDRAGPVVWSWGISLAVLAAALVSPVAGAMADARASKRRWLATTALLGAAGATLLGVVPPDAPWAIIALFLWVTFFFELAFGFYNGFLPELATVENMDRISAKGFAYGYVGGGLALALEFVIFHFGEGWGLDRVAQLRIGLLIMGLWWAIFSLPAVFILRDRAAPRSDPLPFFRAAAGAVSDVRRTLGNIRAYRMLALFLLGFLFFNDAIQTVIIEAGLFAERDLHFQQAELLLLILAFQFVCLPGAMLVGWVIDKLGQKRTLMAYLGIWIALLIAAYFIQTKLQFWCLSVFLGLVMGGTQSVSRSIMALMTPKERTAEFFGFFNFSGRATSWIGTLLFGAVIGATGEARLAILSLLALFIIGTAFTAFVNVAQGQREARA